MAQIKEAQIEALRKLPVVRPYDGSGGPNSPFYGQSYLSSRWYSEKTWTDYSEDSKGRMMYRWDITQAGVDVLNAWDSAKAASE